jgi:phosphatidylserine/phosphatidylglycerophosphate/cardiolipin synthase-like enzyme
VRRALERVVAVADGRVLLLPSANLTESAFSLNMELGVLVHSGAVADQVKRRRHSGPTRSPSAPSSPTRRLKRYRPYHAKPLALTQVGPRKTSSSFHPSSA